MRTKSFLSALSLYALLSCASDTQPVERAEVDFANNEIKLVSEKKGDFDYTIVNDEMIINKKRKGAMELALTSDYIVTLERDYKVDGTDESTVGRDFNKLPHTVFLYDYSLNLKKILNIGIPLLRIAADPKENTLYAIGVNPDFTLIKCELGEY